MSKFDHFVIGLVGLGCLLAQPVLAGNGTHGSDPRVAEFLAVAKTACRWMGLEEALAVDTKKCNNEEGTQDIH